MNEDRISDVEFGRFPLTGKSGELVWPATTIEVSKSTAMALAAAFAVTGQNVQVIKIAATAKRLSVGRFTLL
jgi:hypothetical protein